MKLKTNLLALSYLMLCASGAYACVTPSHVSNDSASVIKEYGAPIPDSTCEWIKKHKVRLSIEGKAEVLSGTAIGWAVVRLIDNNNVASDSSMKATYADSSDGSTPRSRKLLYAAIEHSIKQLDMQEALNEIQARKKIK